MPTGQEAPWRGSRITRTSWQKYLPPNWAPMPNCWRELQHLGLELEVAEAAPELVARRSAACRGSGPTRSFAVFSANSADVPPMTTARWYGGQAAVPSSAQLLVEERAAGSRGLSSALVSWNR